MQDSSNESAGNEPLMPIEQMGGPEVAARVVQDHYERVLADPELAPFFANTDMERLRRMQLNFMASALDGPSGPTSAELTKVHAGRGITPKHYSQFCGHFADAMEAQGVDATVIDQALGRLAIVRDRVLGISTTDG